MRKTLLVLLILLGWAAPTHAAATITFQQATSDTTDASVYTFTAQNIGTAAADRCVIVSAESRRGAASATTVTVTIGGNATTHQQHGLVEASSSVVSISWLTVAAGTTADVVVTYSATMLRARIAVYTMTGGDCTTQTDVDSSDIDDPSVALDVPAGGAAAAVCVGASAAGTTTWTGITERHDAIIESALLATGASDAYASTQTGLTMTCTMSGTTQGETGIFVAWGPAGAGGSVAKPAIIGQGLF